MSVMTIHVSADHVGALRESLLTARRALEEQLSTPDHHAPGGRERVASREHTHDRLGELDSLLAQIDEGDDPGQGLHLDLDVRELTGARAALWTVVYDAACAASEQLAEDLNEYWRGAVDLDATRRRIADLGARVQLLESLGPPPGD